MKRFFALLPLTSTLALSLLVSAPLAGSAGAATGHAAINPGHSVSFGYRTLSSGCHIRRGGLPDPRCTPGAYFSLATPSLICHKGYSAKVRHVTASTKLKVYAEYGIYSHRRGQYEVDHLVPLEGGGSNDISNLFPQPAYPKPGFHQKDSLENEMRYRVCGGRANLRSTQRAIAHNWLGLYRSWF